MSGSFSEQAIMSKLSNCLIRNDQNIKKSQYYKEMSKPLKFKNNLRQHYSLK